MTDSLNEAGRGAARVGPQPESAQPAGRLDRRRPGRRDLPDPEQRREPLVRDRGDRRRGGRDRRVLAGAPPEAPRAASTGERSAKWESFERWTDDFPRLDDDPPATLELWKRILIYGVAFGTADRMIKSGRIPEPVLQSSDGSWAIRLPDWGLRRLDLQRQLLQLRLLLTGRTRVLQRRRRRLQRWRRRRRRRWRRRQLVGPQSRA